MSQPIASLYATALPTAAEPPLTVSSSSGSQPPQPEPASSSRFEVLRAHAAGGLGQVSVALDKELHRKVALKEIHPRLADRPDSRARFLLEAEVTGSLEHPGVVPVYSLGQWPDGRPYYVMRLIRGESLEDAVRHFHEFDCCIGGCTGSAGELGLRKLLRRFIDVCNAVDYAHSRGVLHRDIKPSNVMLGPYGETLVVDWGLAKTAACREELPNVVESLLAPQAAGSTPATRIGSALGTPAYMSPEQAAGALDLLGPASDVYSLGATLYAILTGRPPFIGDDFATVRRLILEGVFPSPRCVNATLPRPLEAICLKAMALEPGQRYASARALAEDIEKWLADAPVAAYRESRFERAARALRRHRTWTFAGAASLLVITMVAVAASFFINRARLQAEEAHQQRVLAQIDLLTNAEPAAVPLIIENLRPYDAEVTPRLRAMRARGNLGTHQRMRLDMALVEHDPSLVGELGAALLTCQYDDFPVLRDRLRPHASELAEQLWQTLHDIHANLTARFRAGLALASYSPDSDRWTDEDAVFLAQTLLSRGIERQRELRTEVYPIAARLLPEVYRLFKDEEQPSEVRHAATAALADWAATQPQLLAAAISEASPEQFTVLLPALANADRTAVVATLRDSIRRQPRSGGQMTEEERVVLGRRRAAAAIALLRIGEDPLLAELFTPDDDPESQTQFVAGLKPRGVKPAALIACLDRAPRTQEKVRSGLILGLGEFAFDELSTLDRENLVERLDAWYRADPSSVIHAACGWLLRNWESADRAYRFDHAPHAADYRPGRQWFLEQVGAPVGPGMSLTMIVFRPGEFLMGSPLTECDRQAHETQHRVKLTRPFAIADRIVSRALYYRFIHESRGAAAAQAYLASVEEMTADDKHPATGLNWYDAVLLVRWLTAESGMAESDQCYADPATLELDAHGYPTDRQWPFHPERRGFRLPTEAEWEYACRAGTITAFSFGSDPSVAGDYGWFQGNSSGSLRSSACLRPTGSGLVSMHGNSAEWCHDWLGFIPGGTGVDPVGAVDGPCRAIRSGSYLSGVSLSRSASRAGLPPEFAAPYAGVRVVRTLTE